MGLSVSAAASAGSSPRRAVIKKANSAENKRVEILATDILNEQARLGVSNEVADVGNTKATTSLIKAIQKGNKQKALDILKTEDVDINIQNKVGDTALMVAIARNQPDIARQILDKDGVDVNLKDQHGITALMLAIDSNQPEIAKQILDKDGVDINLKNQHDSK